MHTLLPRAIIAWLLLVCPLLGVAAEPELKPYDGPSTPGVDTSTLQGKVLCGYQGWFNCEGDGANLGWTHWAKGGKAVTLESVAVDLWPDVSELAPAERFATAITLPDGKPAEVFSSHRRETVLRHFRWMRDYGIDGVFVQRFANGLASDRLRRHKDVVLLHCREGAHREGRAYAVMYDLSGLGAGQVARVADDWKLLAEKLQLGGDKAYLQHAGKPLVAVWGVGFGDDRKYTLAECRQLVDALHASGASVLLGVPTGWRQLDRDAAKDPELLELLAKVEVVSPWTVGRYRTPAEARRHGERNWQPDVAWCRERKVAYLPVVFPGFSWKNLHGGPLDQIPRLKGEFLWSQFEAVRAAGAGMVYVAMFDEVDEATAIFKCTTQPPVAERFVSYQDVPSDHYLWLTGQGGRLLRGELRPGRMPERK